MVNLCLHVIRKQIGKKYSWQSTRASRETMKEVAGISNLVWNEAGNIMKQLNKEQEFLDKFQDAQSGDTPSGILDTIKYFEKLSKKKLPPSQLFEEVTTFFGKVKSLYTSFFEEGKPPGMAYLLVTEKKQDDIKWPEENKTIHLAYKRYMKIREKMFTAATFFEHISAWNLPCLNLYIK